jgi:4-hydroxybenzoate polyprenyltransferase
MAMQAEAGGLAARVPRAGLAQLVTHSESVLADWVRFFRPEFWVVSVFPAWVGWSLATGQTLPDQRLVLDALARVGAVPSPVSVLSWAARHWRIILAILSLGPFLGGSIMVTNDYYDRRVDALNPKKARSPLGRGTATPGRARFWMVALTAATLAAGFAIHPWFGALLAFGVLLSFLYSAPPLRLKARPLGDVAVNALGYGGVATVAGWVLGGGWGRPFPLGAVFIIALAIAAGYLPTMMADYDADRRSGLQTTAVSLGLHAAWLLGLEALLVANATMAGLAVAGGYVSPSFVLLQAPFLVVEVAAYLTLVRPERGHMLLGGCVVSTAFFGNLAAFLLTSTFIL